MIVISIVGLLAALSMPAINKGMAAARKSTCLSNMRQLGVAMRLYCSESDGSLPYAYWVGMSGGGVSWDDLISPYLGLNLTQTQINAGSIAGKIPVLACPSDRLPALSVARRSYSMPRGDYDANGPMGVGKTLNVSAVAPQGMKLASISSPTTTLLLVEFSTSKSKGDSGDNLAGNAGGSVVDRPTQQQTMGMANNLHESQFSYLFVDGHAESLAPKQTIGNGSLERPRGMWTVDPND